MRRRLFIAINLPQDIKDYLIGLIDCLKNKNSDKDIKWVRADNLHLTLHFLGYIEENLVNDIKEQIAEAIKEANGEKSIFQLQKIGGFPNIKRTRVIFIEPKEIKGDMNKIQKIIGEHLKKLNVEVDERPWHPHLTLGRTRQENGLSLNFLDQIKVEPKEFNIKSIDLMESHLSRKGPTYECLFKKSLK